MSSVVGASVHANHKRLQKVGHLGSLGPIPMFQAPFNSSCAALLYENGMKFFHQAVPEIHAIDISEFQYNRAVFSISSRVPDDIDPRTSDTFQGKNPFMYTAPSFYGGGIVIEMDDFLLYSTTKSQD
jgi:hypothetical protein